MKSIRVLITAALVITFMYGKALGVSVGKPPPSFVLLNQDGRRVDISTLFNKPTVIYFTHNACHYCTQIIAMLKRANEKYGSEKLRIIGINVMAKDNKLIKVYREELGFIFPMFAGNRGDLLEAYEIYYVPKLVFIDGTGIVRQVVGHYIHEPELHENIDVIISNRP